VKLRVLGEPGAAAAALQGGPGLIDVAVVGRLVQVGFTGGDEKIAEIVSHLVHRGFGVVGVEQERNELERIFLEATSHHAQGGNS
jgi:ABC-2 type transport system ATP-binding protein